MATTTPLDDSTAERPIVAPQNTVFLMADYGHDPTETAVPYAAFKEAGYKIQFATENGKQPECDKKMLEGFTQRLLGAKKDAVDKYKQLTQTEEWKNPLAWSAPDFTLDAFDLVILPGGHEKRVRQIIDSESVHKLLVDYFPKTKKPGTKAIGAICHGVQVLARSTDETGRSVLRECVTTSLPARFEQMAYWSTRAVLGDYYKTYGAGSEDVEDVVKKVLGNEAQWKSSLNPGPFFVEDEKYNYISARYPGDASLFAEEIIKLMESFRRIV